MCIERESYNTTLSLYNEVVIVGVRVVFEFSGQGWVRVARGCASGGLSWCLVCVFR